MLSRQIGVKVITIEVAIIALLVVIGGLYFLFGRNAPTCSDERKNQGEEQVDCGGPCMPCEIKSLSPIEFRSIRPYPSKDALDVLLVIENPSKRYGLRSFHYRVALERDDTVLLEGDDFLLPGQTKYIARFKVEKPAFFSPALKGEITHQENAWSEPRLSQVPLVESFALRARSGRYEAEGTIRNQLLVPVSVAVVALLKDRSGQIITFTESSFPLRAGEERKTSMLFPEVPAGSYRVEVISEVNLFDL